MGKRKFIDWLVRSWGYHIMEVVQLGRSCTSLSQRLRIEQQAITRQTFLMSRKSGVGLTNRVKKIWLHVLSQDFVCAYIPTPTTVHTKLGLDESGFFQSVLTDLLYKVTEKFVSMDPTVQYDRHCAVFVSLVYHPETIVLRLR